MRGRHTRQRAGLAAAVFAAALTVGSFGTKAPDRSELSGRLVSIQEFQTDFGDMCFWEPEAIPERISRSAVGSLGNLFEAFDDTASAAQSTADAGDITRPPVRTIRDTYPIYSSIAVDTQFNEVALQDTNQFGIKF